MELFPFYIDVEDKTFLIVGGGAVAKRKLNQLRNFNCHIIVIAKNTDIEGNDEKVQVVKKSFSEEDLLCCDYVIAATDDKALNARIAHLCKDKGIPVNVADSLNLCTFVFPGIIKRGPLVIGINTSGTSPFFSRILRQELVAIIPDNIEDILSLMGEVRGYLAEREDNQKQRSAVYRKIYGELLNMEELPSLVRLKEMIDEMI